MTDLGEGGAMTYVNLSHEASYSCSLLFFVLENRVFLPSF